MANEFESRLRTELAGIDVEVARLEKKRTLIQELIANESGGAVAIAEAPRATRRRAAKRTESTSAKRKRRPRGMITSKVREFLRKQTEPVHATEILAFLEKNDAAPQSAKPMPTLQSTLQRMKEIGEIENRGRNRWALISASDGPPDPGPVPDPPLAPTTAVPTTPPPPPAPVVRAETPPVVTSTTTFGNRPTFQ